MACNIIEGSVINCRDSIGGIKTIYLAPITDIATITETSGVVTNIAMVSGKKFWTFELEKENAMFEEKETTSVENGTTFWEQDIAFNIKKLLANQRNNMKILAQLRLAMIVTDNNGNSWLAGRYYGMDKVGTNTAKTGKAMGDLNGYELAFKGKETAPMFSVTGTIPTS